jgi:hypothetical protein
MGTDILAELVSYLAPHLRKRIMQIYTVQSPLSNTSLYVLSLPAITYGRRQYNKVDGELVIVEPIDLPRLELFLIDDDRSAGPGKMEKERGRDVEGRWWDAEAGVNGNGGGDGDGLDSH